MKMSSKNFLIKGIIFHSTDQEKLNIIQDGMVVIENGKVAMIGKADVVLKDFINPNDYPTIELSKQEFLMPGLIDTHIHAAQYQNIGLGYDSELLDWLNKYIFKLESKFSNIDFARKAYEGVVQKTLDCGTTTACYFATIHADSTLLLADICISKNQRAFVGKVSMDQNSPENYIETTADSLQKNEYFIQKVLEKNSPLVQPIITPRFAVACSMELMKGLGALAKKYNLNIQTHVSENKQEVKLVKNLFPECNNYCDVYDKANLLTNKTVLAHAVYLEDEEVKLVHERGSSISHCALSNTCLKSGLCKVKFLSEQGIKIGLGTDVAGGSAISIHDAMRSTITTSIHLSFFDEVNPINYIDTFYLATLGGAKALAIEDKVGNFEVGKEFDAIIVNMGKENTASHLPLDYSPEELLQKFIFSGDDRNITKVFVSGTEVKNVSK